MAGGETVKACAKCKKSGSLEELFYKKKRYSDGYDYYCKLCRRQYGNEYQRSEAGKLRKKEYQEKNHQKLRSYAKEYYKEYAKEYKKKNSEKLKAYKRAWREKKIAEKIT
jgi:hypothetical protein